MNTSTHTLPARPEIELFRCDNILESPAHMIDYALCAFGPSQAAYLDGHRRIRATMEKCISDSNMRILLGRISDDPEFKAAHAVAVWAAKILVAERLLLAERTDIKRTDRFIARRAEMYGVTALPVHFGTTGIVL